MLAPEVTHREIHSFDGTRVAYQVHGDGPAVVLANGLGGTYSAWRHQFALLGQKYKTICWDYRGLFRSGRPPRLDTLALNKQVKDLELILEAEGVDRALFIGWSMGVQFNFEYYRHHSDQFVGLIVLNGVAGRPFETALGFPLARQMIDLGIQIMKYGSPAMSLGSRVASRWSGLVPVLQRIGMVASTLDMDVFNDLILEYSGLDFEAYSEILRHLGEHDASDLLHRVAAPTLLITGTKDFFTPMKTAEEIASIIPDATLVTVEGGTHYAAVEFPREVNEHIRGFIKNLGYGTLS